MTETQGPMYRDAIKQTDFGLDSGERFRRGAEVAADNLGAKLEQTLEASTNLPPELFDYKKAQRLEAARRAIRNASKQTF